MDLLETCRDTLFVITALGGSTLLVHELAWRVASARAELRATSSRRTH